MKRLEGKVSLITGAGRGIGRAIAETFAKAGSAVYALDLPEREMDAWAAQLQEQCGVPVVPIHGDLTDSEVVKGSVLRIKKEQGKLDVLVNNAGIVTYEFLGMVSKETMKRMFDVNVFAVVELMQYASRLMARKGGGSIINMASQVAVKGAAGQLSYAASKGAVISATRSAAKELAGSNVRVNAVAPGMVATERFSAEMESRFSERAEAIGMGRLAQPQDIANACLFLAGDESAYITGQVLGVDGSLLI